ncbi:MAG TPA: undecaprenyl-phosphate glucose phosphotransferase [Candidatus Acidoferrum sp.]|nr:undecaprenyl-phosphate glucose phosphotransferase [Candidatus Acidoferrum sp.]
MLLRLKLYRLYLKTATYLLPLLAFEFGWRIWLWYWAYIGRPAAYAPQSHFLLVLVSTFVWAFLAEHYRVTSVDELFRERTGARAAWSASLATGLVLLAALYFSRNDRFPRGLLISCVIALLVLAILLRAVFRTLFRLRIGAGRASRLLVVGADQFAREAARKLQRLSFAPCEIAGYVRLPGQEIAVQNARIYEIDQLGALHSESDLDEAVIAIHPAYFSQMPKIIANLESVCLPARAIVDLGEGIVIRERLFQLGNLQMLDLTTTPADSLDYALLKRVFDICFSSAVLALAAPLFALIALAIRFSSAGPVFFTQERVGLNGKPFHMYKFRTMRMSSASESETRWTTENDPRRTRVGTFLRKTSLDELPQFCNVLRGEMSVVGPRPERPHFVRVFLREVARYNHRHALKVGITGWAQVNGWRGDTSIEKRIEYDLYYLQNWSLGFDLRIIVMTVFSALVSKNAY